MKTVVGLIAPVLALVAGRYLVHAEPPAPAKTTGHVLVLDGDRTLDGDIERVGAQYRIRRDAGETWIPATNESQLCDSYEDAYQSLRRRSNPDDCDEHIRLAQWCRDHELKKQAVSEARLALAIQPDSGEGKRLLAMLQQDLENAGKPTHKSSCENQDGSSVFPLVDVDPDSLTTFITHVQPIFMNACASCHGAQHTGTFKLVRVSSEGILSRKGSLQNLSAVLWQVNPQSPELSPVLTKARLPHGDQVAAPLNNKTHAVALQTLQDWVKDTLAKNPLLPQQLGLSPTADTHLGSTGARAPAEGQTAPEPRGSGEVQPVVAVKPTPTDPVGPPAAPSLVGPPKGSGAPATNVAPPAADAVEPVDEFDAAIFNRQFHPDKK
jgi:hypothetical protein